MINLVLLTGFLGTGKTTMMQNLLTAAGTEKHIGVIVNEFGEVNVDAALVEREGVKMLQLSNGSIFCACIKEDFLKSLIEMSGEDVTDVFIEASGLADPASMPRILRSVEAQTKKHYCYKGTIGIVDAEYFADLLEVLPVLHSQIEYSGAVIINKADLVSSQQVEKVSGIVSAINPAAFQYITSFCRVDLAELMERLKPVEKEDRESGNTRENRPKTFILKSVALVERDILLDFLAAISPAAYRVKGFVRTEAGVEEVSAVRERIAVETWTGRVPALELVIISSVGIRMMSLLADELEKRNLRGKLSL